MAEHGNNKTVKLSTEEMKWKAEQDARTLQEAEVIRGDAKRLKAAMKIMDEQMQAMHNAREANEEAVASKIYPKMGKEGY